MLIIIAAIMMPVCAKTFTDIIFNPQNNAAR